MMPTLGNALDFQKYEARNLRNHQLATAPLTPVAGQQYYNTSDNTLYWWNGTAWQSAGGGGGGSYLPLAGGTLTGNLGVGIAAPAWYAGYKAIQVGQSASLGADSTSNLSIIGSNSYYDGTSNKARVTGPAVRLLLQPTAVPGGLQVDTAPSTTAGATQTITTRLTLDAKGNVGVGVIPAAWGSAFCTLGAGQTAVLWGAGAAQGTGFADNTYHDGTNFRALVAGSAGYLSLNGSAIEYRNAPSVAAGAIQTFTSRLSIATTGDLDVSGARITLGNTVTASGSGGNVMLRDDTGANRWIMGIPGSAAAKDWFLYDFAKGTRMQVNGTTGTLTLTPDAGQPQISASSGVNLTLQGGVGASVQVQSPSLYFLPGGDSTMYCGHPAWRWITAYFVNAATVGSSLDLKENITPLDPAACVASVLETDWVNYVYKPPAPPERGTDTTDEEWSANQESYRTALAAGAVSRRQKGYVLDSPDHKVGSEFGLPDRKNRSDGADLAVVACALQSALKEIAELKERVNAIAA